jgi:hypothetical protein
MHVGAVREEPDIVLVAAYVGYPRRELTYVGPGKRPMVISLILETFRNCVVDKNAPGITQAE